MTTIPSRLESTLLRAAIALALGLAPAVASAQDMDHSAHAEPRPTSAQPRSAQGDGQPPKSAEHDHSTMQSTSEPAPTPPPPEEDIDHAAMGHGAPAPEPAPQQTEEPEVDHAAMGHTSSEATGTGGEPPEASGQAEVDHAAMGHDMPPETETQEAPTSETDHSAMGHDMSLEEPASEMDHSAMGHDMPPEEPASEMDHAAMGHGTADADSTDLPPDAAPLEPIPQITDTDRAAAFPDVAGHAVHDNAVHWFALLDRFETWDEDDAWPVAWEGSGWIGTDLDRAWVRSEGEAVDGTVESANVELFYGRAIARWWDAVVGVRHDFGDGPSRTFAAVGVMGLAPYMFEVEATAYLGESGQTGLGLEAEYETLFTNRLILQSVIEAEAWSKDDPARGTGSGLGKVEAGLRLRYEFTRRFAPYVGIVRERLFGRTADFREARGGEVDDTRFVIGLRTWF